jgi:hypothetical protein
MLERVDLKLQLHVDDRTRRHQLVVVKGGVSRTLLSAHDEADFASKMVEVFERAARAERRAS